MGRVSLLAATGMLYLIPPGAIPGLEEVMNGWVRLRQQWKLCAPTTSYWKLPGELGLYSSVHGTAWTRLVLAAVGAELPPDFHFDGHGARSGAATGASAVGVQLHRVCFMGGWSIRSDAVNSYIDPTAPATPGAYRFFGWLAPSPTHGT